MAGYEDRSATHGNGVRADSGAESGEQRAERTEGREQRTEGSRQ